MEKIEMTIWPAKNKVEALEKFASITIAMSAAHAVMLRDALAAKDADERETHLKSAAYNLRAQMELAQIEMFIHNLPD